MAVVCQTCFSSIPSGSRFCTVCGYSQVPGQSAPPTTAAPAYLPPPYAQPPYAAPIQPAPVAGGITPVHLFLAVLAIVLALLAGFWMLSSNDNPKPSETSARPTPPVPPAPVATVTPQPSPPAPPPPAPFSNEALAESGSSGWFVILGGAAASSTGAVANASRQARRVGQCLGHMPYTGNSTAYAGMNPGYEIVFLGAYADRSVANRVLAWAKRCRRDAYLRQASWVGMD